MILQAVLATFCVMQSSSLAFSPITTRSVTINANTPTTTTTVLHAQYQKEDNASKSNNNINAVIDRRKLFGNTVSTAAAAFVFFPGTFVKPSVSNALDVKKVVVAGSTGQTGRRVLEKLANKPGLEVIGGVRNVDKATKSLSESSTVVRGAMVQKVSSVDTSSVLLKRLDIVADNVDELSDTLSGADSLVIAVGFIPGNPFKMNDEAHKVDNVGTCKLIDAAKKAGVQKVVLVSSILTDAKSWGKEKSAGFQVTNAFGNVLDEKIVAEKYLRASGIDYTIVRPGGLKAKPPTGGLVVSAENTLEAGEISRDLVADVCVAALTDRKASNKVLEIIEAEEGGPKVFNGLSM